MKIEKSSETIFIVDNSVQQKIKSLIEDKYNNIIHFYKIDEILKIGYLEAKKILKDILVLSEMSMVKNTTKEAVINS